MPEEVTIETYVCTECGTNEDFDEVEGYLEGWVAVLRRGYGSDYILDPPFSEAAEDNSARLYCQDCVDSLLFCCNNCDRWNHEDFCHPAGYDNYCETCYYDIFTRCEDCEESVYNEDAISVEGGERLVCSSCHDSYNLCCECGDYYYGDDGHWDEDDEWWCHSCHNEGGALGRGVNGYSYRPVLMFRWSMGKHGHGFLMQHKARQLRTAHYYGMELEVEPAPGRGATGETVRQEAEYINSNYGDFLYLKRDSSVPSGFEIVSHPATLEWWHEQGTKMFGDILMRLRNNGFQSHNGGHCGLHIHTNKNALSRLQAMRMTEFIFFESNRTKMKMLSRRGASSLRTYSSLEIPANFNYGSECYEEWTSKQYAKYIGKSMMSRTRNALYFGQDTAELRLFRGTLRDDRIWASLQFFDLLIQYCTNEQAGDPSWREFRNYAHRAPRQYAQIQSYLLEKQI